MALNCGIVGLPNVGKSTIFSALTSSVAEAANYPFCTIDPNKGIVNVADERLDRIASLIPSNKTVYTTVEFVDIAGLVRGASEGEGLGNQFLANIRETNLIIQVVRCFEGGDIVHVEGNVDALRDIETIATELALKDLASVEKAIERHERLTRAGDSKQRGAALSIINLLKRIQASLNELQAVRVFLQNNELSEEELKIIDELCFLTAKPQIYVCNISEEDLLNGVESNAQFIAVRELVKNEGAELVTLCGTLEADIAQITDAEERALFLEESGLKRSGLDELVQSAYRCLGLGAFFTVGGIENRAWSFRIGETAPQCAGKIHTDFEKGFIKAEVYSCEDLFQAGSEAAVRSAGKLRLEGKGYIVKTGDVMHFKFNN